MATYILYAIPCIIEITVEMTTEKTAGAGKTGRHTMNRRRRVERKKRAQQRRMVLFLILPWIAVLLNLILLLQMRGRIRIFDRELNRINAMLSLDSSTQTEGSLPESVLAGAEYDYVSLHGLESVEAPVKRSSGEVLAYLAELSKGSDVIREIYRHKDSYPQKLLEALANNPEMADFVSGYPTAEKKASGGLTAYEKAQEYPLFLQWDPRWGYAPYGDDSCVGLAGCGPTCLSMVLYYLTGDERLTPDQVAAYSMENGYYVSGTGTAWALLSDLPPLYGVKVGDVDISEQAMKGKLDQGQILIVSVGEGDFTVNGHFIVVYGYDRDGFWINDPNCVARSRETWSYSRLGPQIKNIWSFV